MGKTTLEVIPLHHWQTVILVLERAVGGELFDTIVHDSNANKISEQTMKAYFYQSSTALCPPSPQE